MEHRYHQQGNPNLPASACQHHGRDGIFFLYRTGERSNMYLMPILKWIDLMKIRLKYNKKA